MATKCHPIDELNLKLDKGTYTNYNIYNTTYHSTYSSVPSECGNSQRSNYQSTYSLNKSQSNAGLTT